MNGTQHVALALLRTLEFAAAKHRDQRRKDPEASPYINHPIQVARLLAEVGGIEDAVTLQAALLHDTIEDTETTPADLTGEFGAEVCGIVQEVTDDKQLPRWDRMRLQIEKAPHLSPRAKTIKVADKISNVRDITAAPPRGWSHDRRAEYVEWAAHVVNGCRGANAALDACWDGTLLVARRALER
ncbi:MAG: HD domain-containing protein [Gemmatimonadetes bacterium]|nr:HD domain-containing protein [Gemmatimonadota bacterium]